jgi:hypothetical protein
VDKAWYRLDKKQCCGTGTIGTGTGTGTGTIMKWNHKRKEKMR